MGESMKLSTKIASIGLLFTVPNFIFSSSPAPLSKKSSYSKIAQQGAWPTALERLNEPLAKNKAKLDQCQNTLKALHEKKESCVQQIKQSEQDAAAAKEAFKRAKQLGSSAVISQSKIIGEIRQGEENFERLERGQAKLEKKIDEEKVRLRQEGDDLLRGMRADVHPALLAAIAKPRRAVETRVKTLAEILEELSWVKDIDSVEGVAEEKVASQVSDHLAQDQVAGAAPSLSQNPGFFWSLLGYTS
jgi:chromosome segregation ATPase